MALTPIELLRATVAMNRGADSLLHSHNLRSHEQRYLADLALIQALAPAGEILEIGAAPCHMTALLKLSGYPVVGVDLEPERVRPFVEQLGLDVRPCDIERAALPFGDDSFACAMLCETFEHLRIDPAFVLSELNRVMRPGAALLLTTPNVYSLPSLGRFLRGHSVADPLEEFGKLRSLGHMGHVREYSAREVVRFLQASGFVVHSIDYRYYPWPVLSLKKRLLRLAYRLAPKRFRRDIVIIARKAAPSPRLTPLVPAAA